jgi:hypothetical protein
LVDRHIPLAWSAHFGVMLRRCRISTSTSEWIRERLRLEMLDEMSLKRQLDAIG